MISYRLYFMICRSCILFSLNSIFPFSLSIVFSSSPQSQFASAHYWSLLIFCAIQPFISLNPINFGSLFCLGYRAWNNQQMVIWNWTLWLYGGCLVGMFLDLVSVGHISMSHAKICPGTPPLVNISFRPRRRPTPESCIPRTSRMLGGHGMMPWYWPRGGMKRPRWGIIIVQGAGGHHARASPPCDALVSLPHYQSLSYDEVSVHVIT